MPNPYEGGLVEVVYESVGGRTIAQESEPKDGPTEVIHDGHVFHLVVRDVVSRSGESTHDRVHYLR